MVNVCEGIEGCTFVTKNYADEFKWYEYLVFGAVLACSLGIGVFYGFFGNKNKTNEEFLMAGRSMSILPVTLSLICSFVSAITLLGNPVEVYFYGSQYTIIAFAFIPMTLVLMFLYVPVFFSLQLTSAYQYFEWRFSLLTRFVLSVFALIHLIIYMPLTVYGPALALDAVAGIDNRISAAAIFLVCIAYSSLGGLKAVLWTDALQAFVMIAALISVVGFGIYEVGGISDIWNTAADAGRTEFFNFDPDLRTRHTFWTATIGGFLMWLPLFGATQAQVQRYNSVPTLRDSRKCLIFNMVGMMVVICLCSVIGLMIFTHFAKCDPLTTEQISSPDQLVPLFVMDVLVKYPVVPGLLVAGLTCGSLSTVSSALNSLTAIVTEDFVKYFRPNFNEFQLGLTSKIVSTVSGFVAFALVFVVAEVNKTINLSPFSTLMHGSLLGPILGAFTLGMFFPWANEKGTLCGIAISIVISGFIGLGSIIAGIENLLADQKLKLETCGCETIPSNISFTCSPNEPWDAWKKEESSFGVKAWSMSYIWLPGVGGLSTVIWGLIFSSIFVLVEKNKNKKVNVSLLSKPFIRLWKKCFGEAYMENYLDYDSPAFVGGVQPEPNQAVNQSVTNLSEGVVLKDTGEKLTLPRAHLWMQKPQIPTMDEKSTLDTL